MINIINFLQNCCSYYENGDFYTISKEDATNIEDKLKIYVNTHQQVNDSLYDEIYAKAKSLIPNHPFFSGVGSEVRKDKVKLPYKMGSLNEIKTETELGSWLSKYNGTLVLSDKLDGVSCEIIYKRGKFVAAYTRGDGDYGQDITRHVKKIKTVPQNILFNWSVAIRGELLLPKKTIDTTIEELAKRTGKVYQNGRNLVAGLINSESADDFFYETVHFVPYNILSESLPKKDIVFKVLKSAGFIGDCHLYTLPKENISEDFLKKLVGIRKLYSNYEVDGIVVEVDDVSQCVGLERNELNPTYARKFKVGTYTDLKQAEVLNVEWNVSKDGYLKPRLQITPVVLSGATIQYVTGFNAEFIKKNSIGIGSIVSIKRAGDVIPHIDSIVKSSKSPLMPDCDYIWSGVDAVLSTPTEGVNFMKLVYFCKALDLSYLGEGNIGKLFDFGIKTPIQLCTASSIDLDKVLGANGRKVSTGLKTLLNEVSGERLFGALNSFGRGMGERKLKKVIEKYGTLWGLSYDDLLQVDGFSDISAKQYFENYCFANKDKEDFEKIANIKNTKSISGRFSDYKIMFSGFRDSKFEEYLIKEGVCFPTGIASANLLIVKSSEGDSSKILGAKLKGIRIINKEEAYKEFGYEN